jgi:hypothetical protein
MLRKPVVLVLIRFRVKARAQSWRAAMKIPYKSCSLLFFYNRDQHLISWFFQSIDHIVLDLFFVHFVKMVITQLFVTIDLPGIYPPPSPFPGNT